MNKKQILELIVLIAFVAGFIITGLYVFNKVVKKNSFKTDQFKNVR